MERRTKMLVGITGAALVLICLAGYGYYQARDFLNGPLVTIGEPKTGAVFSSPLITIKGTATNVAFLSLDGRQIFTEEDGHWSEQLLLTDGYSIITLEAQDRFGHTAQKRLELVYKVPEEERTSTTTIKN